MLNCVFFTFGWCKNPLVVSHVDPSGITVNYPEFSGRLNSDPVIIRYRDGCTNRLCRPFLLFLGHFVRTLHLFVVLKGIHGCHFMLVLLQLWLER